MRTIVCQLLSAIVVLTLCAPAPALAQQLGDRNDIRKLMEVTGVAELMSQMSGMLLAQLKTMAPGVPESEWTKYEAKLDGKNIIALSVPVYAKHFTPEEIDELIKFYSTPVGQKTISTMPVVIRESMEAGQRWGQEAGTKIIEELKAGGYEIKGQ